MHELSPIATSKGYSSLYPIGFSLLWLLLFWSADLRVCRLHYLQRMGFSCDLQAVEHRLRSCDSHT